MTAPAVSGYAPGVTDALGHPGVLIGRGRAADVYALDADRAGGPVVIDWTNAAAGPPGADVAMAYLIMASSDLDALPWWIRPAAWSLRRVFLRRFQAAVRDDPGPYLAQVARYRLADVNVRPAEAARLLRLTQPGPP